MPPPPRTLSHARPCNVCTLQLCKFSIFICLVDGNQMPSCTEERNSYVVYTIVCILHYLKVKKNEREKYLKNNHNLKELYIGHRCEK